MTVLVACCQSKEGVKKSLGKQASDMLIKLDPQNQVNYILSSNLHASRGDWEDVANARAAMRGTAAKKEAGCSWVKLRDGVHASIAGGRLHPRYRTDIHQTAVLESEDEGFGLCSKDLFWNWRTKKSC